MTKSSATIKELPKQLNLFGTLLLIIVTIEMLVHFFVPLLVPDFHKYLQAIVDSLLLSVLIAPFIWWLIARPLRTMAMAEFTRTEATLGYIVDAVINFDGNGFIESLNPTAEKMFGCMPHEIIGQTIGRIIPDMGPDHAGAPFDFTSTLANRAFRHGSETVGCHKNGTCFPVEISISRLQLENRMTFVAIIHDITERKRAEAVVAEQKEFVDNLVQNSAVPTFVINPEHRVVIWNRACEELTGIRAETMLGRDEAWKAFFDNKRPVLADLVIDGDMEHAATLYTTFDKSSFIPEGLRAEGWYKNINGMDRYLCFNAAPIRNGRGELLAVVETLEEMTERKRYEEQLEYQSNHDELTGLANRNLLADRISQALTYADRYRKRAAVMFIDLDLFKFINDSLGHDRGDQLLKITAGRLTECVRSGDTVAHHGGDEFVIVLPDLDKDEDSAKVAQKIQDAVCRPFEIDGHELVVSCSIGISIYPKDGENGQELLKNADAAMYRAKAQGRKNFKFYTGELNVRAVERMTMEQHLRRALERDEFVLHYQPQLDLKTGAVIGMEALLRWQSPELGFIFPASFIPLAEETGLIVPIGEWVLRSACAQNRALQDAGLPPLVMAINLSPRQFHQEELAGTVARILAETGLEPRYLELEVVESLIMHDVNAAAAILKELKELGVQLSMDDFGTGYSSLSYLKRFPFDKMKIDQSFVREITSDPDSAAIVKTIIVLAHSLNLRVIAEGIETEGQLGYLRSQACDEMQGFYFSRPVPIMEFERMLQENRRLQFATESGRPPERTLLLVDDEAHVVAALVRMLNDEGYTILTATSAREGFELLATNHIDVIVSDLRMPGMSGTEFLSRVRKIYPDIVCIMLSGSADMDSLGDAINRGAIHKFLVKPWDNDLLRESIRSAFKQRELQCVTGG